MNEPTHGELLDELKALRDDLAWLFDMKGDISDLVEISKAVQVGGRGIKWIASIATALLALGGLILAVKGLWQTFWTGGAS